MKILSVEQVRRADEYTISHEPILSIRLMERAAQQLYLWMKERYNLLQPIYIFAGSGNNGGDALALARLLCKGGYSGVQVFVAHVSKNVTTDCETNWRRVRELYNESVNEIKEGDEMPHFTKEAIIVDGLFGSGLSRPITGYWAQFVEHINLHASVIIAIDIPSGMFADVNPVQNGAIIKANFTLSFQFPKLVFMFAENYAYVGEWRILDIGLHPDFINLVETKFQLIDESWVKQLLKPRPKFSHKGTYGHGLLIAGSYQKTGAAVLAARASLRSGIGLLTVHVPQSAYQILQTAVPEAMLCIDETEMNYCDSLVLHKYSALGIGPGIGIKTSIQNAFKKLLESHSIPMVIDADALNILAENPSWFDNIPVNSVLTPHPGEFDRLTHTHDSGFSRMQTQIEFSIKHHVVVVLKGANTSISDSTGNVYFNSTGNPGMATAGSGDVLTGIILSLLAQGYQPTDAAILGVYLHGVAGDLASLVVGEEALIASDIIKYLGNAFLKLKK